MERCFLRSLWGSLLSARAIHSIYNPTFLPAPKWLRCQLRSYIIPKKDFLPKRSEVRVIEEKLNHTSCINKLKEWKREDYYSYSKRNSKLDRMILRFSFERSIRDVVEPGLVLLPPGGLPNLDDRDIMIASGRLYIDTGVVVLAYCGRNLPTNSSSSGEFRGEVRRFREFGGQGIPQFRGHNTN